MDLERRRSPRIVVNPAMRARIVGLDLDAALVELSFDGFRLQSPIAFVDQADYEFLVATPPHRVVRLEATAVKSRVRTAVPRLTFETSFAFTNPRGASTQRGLEALIDGLTSVLEYD